MSNGINNQPRQFKRFCSRHCQLIHYQQHIYKQEYLVMNNPTLNEIQAMAQVLAPLGEYVASIDMQRPMADYSQDEILKLINVVITSFQENLTKLTLIDLPFDDDIPF
ncbi:MAG: hypothetical protein HON94_08275 [Methylococcales bacterium]|jgi:hypothetical protein|nr:hypothetical protein [Methylococcales bacterium]